MFQSAERADDLNVKSNDFIQNSPPPPEYKALMMATDNKEHRDTAKILWIGPKAC